MEREEKMSTGKVRKLQGSYLFRVEGFSGLATNVGTSTESPEFDLCSHVWQLRIFPGGSLEAHKGYISYYLASKSSRQARASYKLSILCHYNPDGSTTQSLLTNRGTTGTPAASNPRDESFSSSGVRVFEAKGLQVDGWGRDKFMPAASLLDPSAGFYVNDTVIFKVEITVYGELEICGFPVMNTASSNGSYASLAKSMYSLLKLGSDSADVTLIVGKGAAQERIMAHRCILRARSPVFHAMLGGSDSPMASTRVRSRASTVGSDQYLVSSSLQPLSPPYGQGEMKMSVASDDESTGADVDNSGSGHRNGRGAANSIEDRADTSPISNSRSRTRAKSSDSSGGIEWWEVSSPVQSSSSSTHATSNVNAHCSSNSDGNPFFASTLHAPRLFRERSSSVYAGRAGTRGFVRGRVLAGRTRNRSVRKFKVQPDASNHHEYSVDRDENRSCLHSVDSASDSSDLDMDIHAHTHVGAHGISVSGDVHGGVNGDSDDCDDLLYLGANFREGLAGEVLIPDIDPATMHELLMFMYTDTCSSVNVLATQAVELFTAAAKYQVTALFSFVEDYLTLELCNHNCLALLQLADTYGATKLHDKALQLAMESSQELVHEPDFNYLSTTLQGRILSAADKSIDGGCCSTDGRSASEEGVCNGVQDGAGGAIGSGIDANGQRATPNRGCVIV